MLDLLTQPGRRAGGDRRRRGPRPATRERLRSRGCVVYLRTSVDQQLVRTRRGNDRPLLNNPDPRGTLERLFALRAPLYTRRSAELTVDTDGRKVKTVVDQICSLLGLAGTRHDAGDPLQLTIDLGERSYPIMIGEGLLDDAAPAGAACPRA